MKLPEEDEHPRHLLKDSPDSFLSVVSVHSVVKKSLPWASAHQICEAPLKRLPLFALVVLAFAITGQAPPVPSPQVPPVQAKKHFPRGAKPTARHRLMSAPRFSPHYAPASFGVIPPKLQYWGNDQYGDCVSAEEAAAKAIYSLYPGMGSTELLIPDQTLISWASANGYLNGADLTDVMTTMANPGIVVSGTTYTDGAYAAVDWTNPTTLSSAISDGPVKIGVASAQFDNVAGVGENNGWWMTGFTPDSNEDHCVCLCGYGTAQQLATMMGVAVPSGINPSTQCWLLFTWSTIGIIDNASLQAICGEAWLRTPTTPQQVPTPTPTPNPTPTPTPTPDVVTVPFGVYNLTISATPNTQPPAPVTVTVGDQTLVISASAAAGRPLLDVHYKKAH